MLPPLQKDPDHQSRPPPLTVTRKLSIPSLQSCRFHPLSSNLCRGSRKNPSSGPGFPAGMVDQTQAPASSSAFSFLSKSWRDVRVSADADFQLIRNRANSFKNLANSFDRELENFINSASTFSVPSLSSSTPAEIDFVRKLQPKLSEFRRTYSAPDFSKRVLERWGPRGSIRIDLSAIKNAIVSEVEDGDGIIDFNRVRRRRRVNFRNFRDEEVKEKENDYWEPIRAFKTRLREFERRSSSPVDIFEGWKSGEFVERVKSSLV